MDFLIKRTASSEIGGIIADIFSENPGKAREASKKSKAWFDRLVTRSLKSSGYELNKTVRDALRMGDLGFPELKRYPGTNVVMARTIRRYFHGGKANMPYKRYKTKKGIIRGLQTKDSSPGVRFAGMMTYSVGGVGSRQYLKVGALPFSEGGRAGGFWTDIFSEWQQAGEVNVNYSGTQGKRGLHGFLAAIGMPIRATTILQRPARPIMKTIIDRMPPSEVFRKKFTEKFLK